MKTIVKKFGGTSVADPGRIRKVAELLAAEKRKDPSLRLAVVVSAMAGETNKLLTLAQGCAAHPAPRELDTLLAAGEQVTVALLAITLVDLGIPARSFLAPQAGIRTDSSFTNARITEIDPEPLTTALSQGVVPIIAGFQGVTTNGSLTTLGRGGSDITAVAVATALKADECYIYTDVEGVLSADPRLCPTARHVEKLAHAEMLEMAALGAKVLHPRSVYFAMMYDVPLVVLSTFNSGGKRSYIVPEKALMERPLVTGIAHRLDDAKITVSRIPSGITAIDRIFSTLAAHEVSVDMITQTSSTGSMDVSFTVPDEVSSRALKALQGLVPELGAEGAHIERDIAKISIVGIGMQYHTGVSARIFSALAKENITPQMIGSSEIKISLVVPRKFCDLAVRALHRELIG